MSIPGRSWSRRAWAATGAAPTLALALALGAMPATGAAPYEVTACDHAPDGRSDAWTLVNTSPESLTALRSCPPGGGGAGLVVRGRLHDGSEPGTVDAPPGARAEWVFDAPPGTVVTGYVLERALRTSGDDNWVSYIASPSGATFEWCQTGPGVNPCHEGGGGLPPTPTVSTRSGLTESGLRVGIRCLAPTSTCSNGFSLTLASATLRGAAIRLTDQVPPVIDPPRGSFVESGWMRGPATVTASARDVGGGVSRIWVEHVASGRTFGTAAPSACDYSARVPCPAVASPTLGLDTAAVTAAVGDGVHTFRLRAEDATAPWSDAHRVDSPTWQARIDNTAPAPPAGLTLSPRWPRDGQPVTASWVVPDQGTASPVTASAWEVAGDGVAPGATGGGTATSAAVGALGGGASGGRFTVRVHLADAAGNADPANAATLTVDTTAPAPSGVAAPAAVGPDAALAEVLVTAPAVAPDRAPVTRIAWESCPAAGGACDSGEGAPGVPVSVTLAPGESRVRVRLVNAAGVEGPARSLTIGRDAEPAAPPPSGGSGETLPTTSPQASAVSAGVAAPRVARALAGRTVEVRVRTAAGWVTRRARTRRDGRIVLPRALARRARTIRYRKLTTWRAPAWVRTGRARVAARPGRRVQLRFREGARLRVRSARAGRRRLVAVPRGARAVRWRPHPGPFLPARTR